MGFGPGSLENLVTTPLLSIVIPVRNGMPFIKEAIASALAEKEIPLEIIVRENGSTDGTLEWLRTIDDERLSIAVSPDSISAADNWTDVCRLARGRYVKILCADDFVCEGGIKRQVDAALAHSGAVLVASPRRVVTEDGKTVFRSRGLRGMHLGEWAIRKATLSGGNLFGEPSSVLFRADALKQSLPFTGEFPYVTDLDMYVKALQHGSMVGLDTVDAGFRLSNSSWSQSIGVGQLHEYRSWLKSIEARGVVRRTRLEKLIAEFRLTVTFFARRAVTTLSRLLRP